MAKKTKPSQSEPKKKPAPSGGVKVVKKPSGARPGVPAAAAAPAPKKPDKSPIKERERDKPAKGKSDKPVIETKGSKDSKAPKSAPASRDGKFVKPPMKAAEAPKGSAADASKKKHAPTAKSGKPAPGKKHADDKRVRPPSLAEAKAAASKLAAAAGLKPAHRDTGNGEAPTHAGKRLTKTPLSKKEMDHYKEVLMQKRHEVFGDVRAMESEALTASSSGALSNMPQHMADQGSDEYDQSLALGLAESQRSLLKEIDSALERIESGEYGICEGLGVAIHKDRLEATPWTRFSLEGARMADRQRLMGT